MMLQIFLNSIALLAFCVVVLIVNTRIRSAMTAYFSTHRDVVPAPLKYLALLLTTLAIAAVNVGFALLAERAPASWQNGLHYGILALSMVLCIGMFSAAGIWIFGPLRADLRDASKNAPLQGMFAGQIDINGDLTQPLDDWDHH